MCTLKLSPLSVPQHAHCRPFSHHRMLSLALAAILVLSLGACTQESSDQVVDEDVDDVASTPVCTSDGTTFSTSCPSAPDTNPSAQPDWDHFAWNTFVALNWPAVIPENNNNQRGFPDLTQSFVGAANDTEVVWETFKEKREVFYQGATGTSADPGPWNSAVAYGPPTQNVPDCADAPDPAVTRIFAQTAKVSYDQLDETIEVASEALESADVLCEGYSSDPQCGTSSANDCCDVANAAVGPRVWKGAPSENQPVFYEVKVNYDFYDYVVENGYYLDTTTAAAATNGDVILPYRTSASAGPGNDNPNRVLSYSAQSCITGYYSKLTSSSDLTPCPMGAVHIKSAWILLQDEDASDYHIADAIYYKTENGSTCQTSGTFGLVGFHIIQRIHTGAEGASTSEGTGGTFIFATWEHTGLESDGYTYANYYQGQGTEPPPAFGFYPTTDNAIDVTRKYAILSGTQSVNTAVHNTLGCSGSSPPVWCNYQLIGTQFSAVDVNTSASNPNDPTNIGQPQYLSNLVIETNDGLQDFQGQPPLTQVIAHFQNNGLSSNTLNAFNRDANNLSFGSSAFNMGGCMGCHGVAQSRGYSFSFVLLGGQAGAGIDTEDQFEIPPAPTDN